MENSSLAASAAATTDRTSLAPLVVGILSSILTAGTAALAIAHAGVTIPGLSALGPGGDGVVIPAAIAFTGATLAAATVSVGAFRRRTWAWALGLVVHAIVVVGAAVPYRGIGSLVGIVLSATCIALLVSRPARLAFLPRAEAQ